MGPADGDAVADRQPQRRDLGRPCRRAGRAASCSAPVLLAQARDLVALQLGDDTAAALGVRVERTRLIVLIVAAVGLLAFATAAAGPIAFVAFLAGPIAARIVGPGGSLLLPAALVGALLVLVADLVGQFAFDTRYPVGVVTGVLGAPYLDLPARPHQPLRRLAVTDAHTLAAEDLTLGVRRPDRRRRRSTSRSRPGASPRSSGPTPAASRRCCARMARLLSPRAGQVVLDGKDAAPAARPRRSRARSACCRSARSRPRASPSPTSSAAAGTRTRGCCPAGAAHDDAAVAAALEADRHRRPRRPRRRRALGRPAPAGVDRDGARPADRHPAAGRADDLPRRRPPGRGARPAHRPQPRRAARRS